MRKLKVVAPYFIIGLLIGSLITIFTNHQTHGYKQTKIKYEMDSVRIANYNRIYKQVVDQEFETLTSDGTKVTYFIEVTLLNQTRYEAKLLTFNFQQRLDSATENHIATDGFIDPETKAPLYPTDSLTIPETKIPFWQQFAADNIRYPITNIEIFVTKVE